MINLVRPYGLQAFSGWVSSIGTLEGLPYTVQELENTICMPTNIKLANANRLGLSHQHQALAVRHGMLNWAYVLAFVLSHGLNQVDCTNDVVCVVQHGKLHALSNSFTSSKVNDSIKPAPLLALVHSVS